MMHSELSPDTSSLETSHPVPRATLASPNFAGQNFGGLAFAMEHKQTPRLFYSRSMWYAVIILAVLVSLAIFIKTPRPTAKLAIEFDSHSRVFEGEVIDGMTVLDALNASMVAGKIPFQFSSKDDSTEFLILNGAGKAPYNMQIILNDQPIDPAQINTVLVHPRDSIVVKMRR